MSPIWVPLSPEKTRLFAFQQFVNQHYGISCHGYDALHQWSIQHIPEFWQAVANFFRLPFYPYDCQEKQIPLETVLQKTGDRLWQNEWFHAAQFNYAEQCLQGEPSQSALVSISESNQRRVLTYAELKQQVQACAQGLAHAGLKPLDRVAAILPNRPETIIAMLSTAALGAIWSSCSPDFGDEAILERFKQIEPTILFLGEGQVYNGKFYPLSQEKFQTLVNHLPSLKQIIWVPIAGKTPPPPSCISWENFLACKIENTPWPRFSFSHPLYILFSSGTTGKPKGMIHGAGNALIQHVKELGLHCDLNAGDSLFFYTTCGWMMWNWMLSGLTLKLTLVLYDGSPLYPSHNRLLSLIEQEKIKAWGTSAKFLSTIEKSQIQPRNTHDLSSLKLILSTGSPLLPSQYDYVYQHLQPNLQLSSISGGTDIVSCFALGNPLLPVYRGEIQCLGLGMDVRVFNENGQSVERHKGELVCCQPFPSMPLSFWKDPDHQRYEHAYFKRFDNFWTHGDFAEITSHQGLIIYGRSDATLNPGGVRIGTAEIYHVLEALPEILESVVTSQPWEGDIRVILFVKLHPSFSLTEALKQSIRHQLKEHASPRHVPDEIIQVPDIPKTFNGKIVELAVHQTLAGEVVKNLNAIANPEALAYFRIL